VATAGLVSEAGLAPDISSPHDGADFFTTSMKGPLESRHTSSERSAPGLSSHPGTRSERVSTSLGSALITCSGRLTSATRLFEQLPASAHAQVGPRDGAIRRFGASANDAPGRDSAPATWRGRHALRCTPRQVAMTSSHNTRAIATRAFARPFVTASRRAQRPRASSRRVAYRAASTKAHRIQGEPCRVMRP
jgi:hypothetical protein